MHYLIGVALFIMELGYVIYSILTSKDKRAPDPLGNHGLTD